MRDGVCSKCRQPAVHAARGGVSVGSDGFTDLWPHLEGRGIRMAHRTRGLWAYACTACGYLELMLEAEPLAWVRQNWRKVPTK